MTPGGFGNRRWVVPRLTLVGTAVVMTLQGCSGGASGAGGELAERAGFVATSTEQGGAVLPSTAGRTVHLRRSWGGGSARRLILGTASPMEAGNGGGSGSGGDGIASSSVSSGMEALSNPVEAFVDSPEPCAARMRHTASKCDSRNRQTVEWAYGVGDSTWSCDTPLPEASTIKCDHVAWASGEGIAIGVLAGLGLAVSVLYWAALCWYGKSRTVRLGQPRLCKAFVIGIGITCLTAFALPGEPLKGSSKCVLSLWSYSLGFDLAFSALALRLWSAASAPEGLIASRRANFSTRKVLAMLCTILTGDAAVVALWAVTFSEVCDPQYEPVGVRLVGEEGGSLAYIRRDSCLPCSHALFWCWVVLKVLLVLLCCWLGAVNGNGRVWMAAYNFAMAGILVAAVVWAGANIQVRTTTEAGAIVLVGIGAMFSILGPKLHQARRELEGKSLVGPSAVGARASYGGDDGGDALFGVGAAEEAGGDGADGVGPRTWDSCGGSSQGSGGGGGHKRTGRGRHKILSGKLKHAIGPPDMDFKGSTMPPLPLPEVAATTAAVAVEGSDTGSRGKGHVLDPPKVRAPFASSEMCSRPQRLFATTCGVSSMDFVPSRNSFMTPPRRGRRSTAGAADAMGVDTMALAAAAAGEAERKRQSGSTSSTKGSPTKNGSLANGGVGGGGGGGGGGEQADPPPPAASLPALGTGPRPQRGGGGSGSTATSAGRYPKPPLNGAVSVSSRGSRASRASRASCASSHARSVYSHYSIKNSGTNKLGTSTSEGSIDGDSASAWSGKESWALDPITMALNGYGWGWGGIARQHPAARGGGGGHIKKRIGSVGGGGSGAGQLLSTGARVRRRGGTAKSSMAGSLSGGGRRSSAAGSLVMHADSGTRLHCPHCNKEVAGCGFKGCSGSLVRPPSFSDEFYESEPEPPLNVQPVAPPAALGPLAPPALNGGYYAPNATQHPGLFPSTQHSGSVFGGSVSAHVAAAVALPPALKNLSAGTGSRLRMSFLRGANPRDTFDDESDDGVSDDNRDRRRSFGATSPTTMSTWA